MLSGGNQAMPEQNESAIVILVPQAQDVVQSVRRRYDLEPAQVPAHITVLYPFKPPHETSSSVTTDLRRLFAHHCPFRFSLVGLETFPGTMYLAPRPLEPFVELTRAVYEWFPETPPYGGAYEEIVPHLTLAGVSEELPFEREVREVEAVLRPLLPIQVTASEVQLMDNSSGRWCVHTTFPLGAG
jgi:2'-5' RNA ligase